VALHNGWNTGLPPPFPSPPGVNDTTPELTLALPARAVPGLTIDGMGIGKWLARQRDPEVWQALTEGQRERLERLGITPLAPEPEAPAKLPTTPISAFGRPTGAHRTSGGRHGSQARCIPQQQQERRAKLTADKLAALAALGLNWAAA
jgi:hypothetical protein